MPTFPPRQESSAQQATVGVLPSSLHLIVRLLPRKLEFSLLREGPMAPPLFQEFDQDAVAKLSRNVYQVLEERMGRIENIQDLGNRLHAALFPLNLATELRKASIKAQHLVLHLPPKLSWIPWELLRDGGQFLCQRFCLARQLHKKSQEGYDRWEQQVEAGRGLKGVLIALGDTKGLEENAPKESEELEQILQAHYKVALKPDVTSDDLWQDMKDGYHIAHFIGHGVHVERKPAKTGWQCCKNTLLSCSTILHDPSEALLPLFIFGNACLSARPTLASLEAYVADLHQAFLGRGVPNYLGTLASVADAASRDFAVRFYQNLTSGATLGEALREARVHFMEKGSTIWAFYVLYGNPTTILPGARPDQRSRARAFWDQRSHPIDQTDLQLADAVEALVRDRQSSIFAGREDKFAEIERFLSQKRSGTLFVTGKAGFGKTALLAQWVDQAHRQGRCEVAYHFFSNRSHILQDVDRAYRNLLRQLLDYYQISGDAHPQDRYSAADRLVYNLLRDRGSRPGRPLVMVLDALDEANPPVETRRTDHQYEPPFPAKLREGIFVLFSARADRDESPYYLEGWLRGAERIHVDRLPRAAIMHWLQASQHPAIAVHAEEGFVDRLEEIADGFSLYLHHLIEDMEHQVNAGQDPSSVLTHSPRGFGAYVLDQLHRLSKTEEVRQRPQLWKILPVLSVALGPLSDKDLAELTELSRWELRSLPWPVSRWLTLQPSGYAFSHKLLADEFEDALGGEAGRARDELIAYCARWHEHLILQR